MHRISFAPRNASCSAKPVIRRRRSSARRAFGNFPDATDDREIFPKYFIPWTILLRFPLGALPSFLIFCHAMTASFGVLVAKANRLVSASLVEAVKRLLPGALTKVVHHLAGADATSVTDASDLLVSGIVLPDGDMLDLRAAVTGERRRARRVLRKATPCPA
jgi:hypothetical protein